MTMKTVEKTIEVLEAFLKRETEIGLAEIAKMVGLNISTAHRIVSTLVARGYLNQRQKRGKYFLAPKFLEFSNVIRRRMKIGEIALPVINNLNKMTSESVKLSVLDRDEAVCIEEIESSLHLRIFTRVGTRFPLHCTAAGKVFLAHMREDELERYVSAKGLFPCTNNTITDYGKLKEELAEVNRKGVAIDREEFDLGVKCIAVPVKDGNGDVVATISISGPSARLSSRRIQEIQPLIKDSGLEVSRAVGYGGG